MGKSQQFSFGAGGDRTPGVWCRALTRRWYTGPLITAAMLAGCATANDPPLLAPVTTGSTSTLSADEMTWNCGRLENAIDTKIVRILQLQQAARSEAQSAAPTLEKLFGRWSFGNTEKNNNALAAIKTERTQADAYNTRLPEVGCIPVDIDARIAAATPK